jgi:phosphatidylglycerophosphate synthase
MLSKSATPLLLTGLRVLLAPVMIFLAFYYPSRVAFGGCLIVAFLSDVFDGILARRFKVATPALRRLDSVADSAFYLAALLVAWHLYPSALRQHRTALTVLAGLEILRYAVDFVKFRREAAYHMWSSKLWGICLFVGFFALLALGVDGWPVAVAIYVGILVDIEGFAVSLLLREWKSDVPSVVHARRLRHRRAP